MRTAPHTGEARCRTGESFAEGVIRARLPPQRTAEPRRCVPHVARPESIGLSAAAHGRVARVRMREDGRDAWTGRTSLTRHPVWLREVDCRQPERRTAGLESRHHRLRESGSSKGRAQHWHPQNGSDLTPPPPAPPPRQRQRTRASVRPVARISRRTSLARGCPPPRRVPPQ